MPARDPRTGRFVRSPNRPRPPSPAGRVERSYKRGKAGCFLLLLVLQSAGVVSVCVYSTKQPNVQPLPPYNQETKPLYEYKAHPPRIELPLDGLKDVWLYEEAYGMHESSDDDTSILPSKGKGESKVKASKHPLGYQGKTHR